MAVEQETAFPGAGRATLAACPPSAKLRLSPSGDLGPDPQQAQAAFPQPPFPSVEYTMSSKCFLGAGVYWYLSRPPEGENQESQAPLCSENGSSLVSASIRGPPHR